MIENIRIEWKKDIVLARQRSQKPENLRKFKELHRDQAARASYFSEINNVIAKLGISNPHEKTALTIEPTHPVQSEFLERSLEKLRINSLVSSKYKHSKLSLLSLEMLACYAPNSLSVLQKLKELQEPLCLLDPLYGFIFWKENDRIRNYCFALDIWITRLQSMPRKLSRELWGKRSDNLLSGGALAGRYLFDDILAPESDPLKRSITPEVQVGSEDELINLINRLNKSAKKVPEVELWFRGQNKDYLTPDRSELAKVGVTPYSNIRESDFTPSLYRKYDSYLDDIDSFEDLIVELAEWVHCAKNLVPHHIDGQTEAPAKGGASVTNEGLTSYQRGLLLQQYGAPSAYLDITRDPEIATWFATHRCTNNAEGKMQYENHSWNSSDPESWPTIFLFPLVKGVHPYMDLASILSTNDALRPARQKCGLLGGAGNLARNYCARYLSLKIRLKPGFTLSNPVPASELFPSASEDGALNFLKEQGLGNSGRHFAVSELA